VLVTRERRMISTQIIMAGVAAKMILCLLASLVFDISCSVAGVGRVNLRMLFDLLLSKMLIVTLGRAN